MVAQKGDWVQIHNIVLQPHERAPQLPDDTSKVPLELWVKGYLINSGNIGDSVEIETITGRRLKGTLTEINPSYIHSFGSFVPELLKIRDQLKSILFGGN